MRATAIRLLVVTFVLAFLAGVSGGRGFPILSAGLGLAAGCCGLLSWAAFCLWARDWAKPKGPSLPLTSVRAGRVPR